MRNTTQQARSSVDLQRGDGWGPKTPVAQTYCFAAPIFPERIQLLLDLSAHTAVLLRLDEEESVSLLRSQRLTPSGAKALLALLQAYPNPCQFQHLFACLSLPLLEEKTADGRNDREIIIRPVRRATATLVPMSGAFGFQLHSLRKECSWPWTPRHSLRFPLSASASRREAKRSLRNSTHG